MVLCAYVCACEHIHERHHAIPIQCSICSFDVHGVSMNVCADVCDHIHDRYHAMPTDTMLNLFI